MAISDLLVVLMATVGMISAFFVAFHPNILYAAIFLIFSLLSVAGMYAALGADFLAGVQLIIYVGGIIIVILFAIMMSQDIYKKTFFEKSSRMLIPAVISGAFFVALFRWLNVTEFPVTDKPVRAATTEAIGRALTGPYALVFQYVAIVLLLGLVGAVIVARPNYEEKRGENK